MSAEPAAESVPLGLEVTSPKPATPVVRSVAPRPTKRTRPATRVIPGPPRGNDADAVPQPGPLVGPRGRAGRPEHRPAEDRQQGGQQRQAGQQHQGDPDRQRRPEALVERELGEAQAHQRGDHREGRERDRLADPAHGPDHRLVRRQAAAELLAHAEHEEHPVVRPGAQDQHDQQELGDRRDLDADLRRLGDDRPRQDEHERRRHERHDRGEHGAEREQEQHDDEQERQLLGQVLRGARRRDRVDLRRELAGQMDLQAGRVPPRRRRRTGWHRPRPWPRGRR